MATKLEYDAGAAAAIKIVQADIESEVPQIFRGRITPELIRTHAEAVAKAVIDAAAAARE